MKISEYQVGQKPAEPLSISVMDSLGRPRDLSSYESHKVRLIDPYDNEVDLGNAVLQTGGIRTGRFIFTWPTDRTLFEDDGDYALQLELTGGGHRDFTTTHTIRVRRVGRNT